MRDVKGRHHTQIATERLLALLPENAAAMALRPSGCHPQTTFPAVDHSRLVLGLFGGAKENEKELK